MKHKLSISLVLLTLLICIIPFSFAQVDSFGTFKQNSAVNLIQTYNSTYCNITSITAPDSTLLATGELMTKEGNKFNYTLVVENTTQLGTYNVCGDCDTVSWCAGFEVTPTGTNLSTSQGLLYVIFLFAAGVIFFLCLYYATKIPWQHQRNEEGEVIGINDLRYVKLFLIVMCYVVLMFSIGLLRSITANFIPELGVSNFFEWMFWIMLSLMYPIIICSFIFGFIIFINNKKLQKAIKRGLPIQ